MKKCLKRYLAKQKYMSPEEFLTNRLSEEWLELEEQLRESNERL
jgi:hypothetical protein